MINTLSLTNFKGVTAGYSLSTGNYISGRNFSGKSAIEQSLRGLVLGYIPGMSKTSAGFKAFASDYPMDMSAVVVWDGQPTTLRIAFEKVKGKEKQTADTTLAEKIDQQTQVLFDPSTFFDLSDNARIQKACELVQATDAKPEAIIKAIANSIPAEMPDLKLQRAPAIAQKIVAAPTINDALAVADTEWKALKKALTEEKARMQKTAEGLMDLATVEQELSKLPARADVERARQAAGAERDQLREQLAANAERLRNEEARKARIQQLRTQVDAAPTAERIEALRAERDAAAAALALAEEKNQLISSRAGAMSSIERLRGMKERRAGYLSTAEHAEKQAQEITVELNRLREHMAKLEEDDKQALSNSENPLRTDDFTDNAEPGVNYVATVTLTKGEDGTPVIVGIEDWKELRSEEEDEDERLAVFNRRDEMDSIRAQIESAETELKAQNAFAAQARADVKHVDEWSGECDKWEAQLAKTTERARELGVEDRREVEPVHALRQAQVFAINALSGAEAHAKACEVSRKMLAELESKSSDAPLQAEEVVRYQARVSALDTEAQQAYETIQRIAAYEQDAKRVKDAAAARAKVDEQIKIVGDIIDLIAEKRQEIVSLSIEAPLKVANKLADGILKGPLVFQEGVLGMQVGTKFISTRTFSGTESAIVMMGLTAGLASRSKLRVLILDEVGRLDVENAGKLMSNLTGMVRDGDIDQWIVIGPENQRMTACAEACAANCIHV